jgi:hypothetical protein
MAGVLVCRALPGPGNALVFPSNGDSPGGTLVAFTFTGANLIPGFPATYVWRYKPVQQTGFYTTFFHARIDGTLPQSNSYYGAHPYPDGGASGTVHNWEISTDGIDEIVDDNANSTVVTKGQWYTQALTVEAIAGDECRMKFYWNLDVNANRVITYESTVTDMATDFPTLGGGVTPGFIIGDAPWSVAQERLSGSLGQFKKFSALLSLADIQSEAGNMNAIVTAAGVSNRWWFKPGFSTVDDLTDSVTGKAAAWSNANKATLGEQL